MKKAETLEHWRNLDPGAPMLMHMEPIPYKAEGSTYGACGIRIDGNPAFIDAVLSHLKELLAAESNTTRLTLSRSPVQTKLTIRGQTKVFANTADRAEVCYIRRHERGHDAQRINVAFNLVERNDALS
jgi:hypothetical protein